MFARARRRLAARYVVLFAIALAAFSLVFFAILAYVIHPAFDVDPDVSNEDAARIAYSRSLERIAVTLALADVVIVGAVGVVGYVLAGRTLEPIRDAHDRQRRFVADASHEMRGPLTAIQITAEAALGPGADDAGRQAALESILAESGRLGRLTTDLLELARTEAGITKPGEERVDLSVVVAEEVERFRGLDPARAADVAVVLDEDLLVRGDPDELARIVGNLLENATRYGRPPIRVRTRLSEGHAVVEVEDHGDGVRPEDADRIFEPFHRVRADERAAPGSGLGLAIASELAHRHGGRLTLEPSRPGWGARFRLSLPRVR